jgi:MFS family permease
VVAVPPSAVRSNVGAQFVSNIGSWMQTMAAQWLMLTLTSSATYVALVRTAAGLPVVLFAILAGTIGDLVDRRRFLLITQTFMLAAAAALGALAIAGLVTPWVLLALIFAVGTGKPAPRARRGSGHRRHPPRGD